MNEYQLGWVSQTTVSAVEKFDFKLALHELARRAEHGELEWGHMDLIRIAPLYFRMIELVNDEHGETTDALNQARTQLQERVNEDGLNMNALRLSATNYLIKKGEELTDDEITLRALEGHKRSVDLRDMFEKDRSARDNALSAYLAWQTIVKTEALLNGGNQNLNAKKIREHAEQHFGKPILRILLEMSHWVQSREELIKLVPSILGVDPMDVHALLLRANRQNCPPWLEEPILDYVASLLVDAHGDVGEAISEENLKMNGSWPSARLINARKIVNGGHTWQGEKVTVPLLRRMQQTLRKWRDQVVEKKTNQQPAGDRSILMSSLDLAATA